MKNTPSKMKFLLPPSLVIALLVFVSFMPDSRSPMPGSPLAAYSTAWNDPKYLKCNTAAQANYMSATEKEVIYILNLVHADPALFAKTVVKLYPAKTNQEYIANSEYYKSLLNTLNTMKPMGMLYPDSLCFDGAQCHAITSGQEGYVGHERRTKECTKKWHYAGECCDYGHSVPLDIVMSLLIDEGITSLGHRQICLGNYKTAGVSIQPHKKYFYNAVLDFF